MSQRDSNTRRRHTAVDQAAVSRRCTGSPRCSRSHTVHRARKRSTTCQRRMGSEAATNSRYHGERRSAERLVTMLTWDVGAVTRAGRTYNGKARARYAPRTRTTYHRHRSLRTVRARRAGATAYRARQARCCTVLTRWTRGACSGALNCKLARGAHGCGRVRGRG